MISLKNNFFLFLILFEGVSFLSFSPVEQRAHQYLHLVLMVYFTYSLLKMPGTRIKQDTHFRKEVWGMILIPLLSIVPCYIYNGQSIESSVIIFRRNFGWLFYFVLHHENVEEKRILNIIKKIAIAWVLAEFVQQFTYPYYVFNQRGDDFFNGITIERRYGIYRYGIVGIAYALLSLFHYMQKYMRFQQKVYLYYILFFILGVYLDVTRQMLVSTVAALLFIIFFYKKSKYKPFYIVISLLIIVFIWLARDFLFGSLLTITANGLDDNVNVRYDAYLYFLNDWKSWECFVLGNGMPHADSVYGAYIELLAKTKGYYLSDIGVLGVGYQYGIFYVICYYTLLFKAFFSRNIDIYLRAFALVYICTSPMFFACFDFNDMLVFSVFLYLCDKSIEKNKLSKTSLSTY